MQVRSKLVICSQCGGTVWETTNLMDDLHNIGTCFTCNHKQSLREQREKVKPLHLYTPTDVKKVRELLLKEQDGCDIMTGLPIPNNKACLDHDHGTQFVRGVLHRQTNAALGKLEGIHTRYLSYWYTGTLPDFLRQAADYLEREDDLRYIHPGFIKRLSTDFNKLNEASKRKILKHLGGEEGANASERKKLFQKAVLTKEHTFDKLKELIERVKVCP